MFLKGILIMVKFLDYDKFYGYHLYKKLRKSSFWGAKTCLALWHFADGLFILINYFSGKEGFLISCIVYSNNVLINNLS